jgi:hypothetical protein
MTKPKIAERPVPPVSTKDAHAIVAKLNEIIARFEGDFRELEAAIGMYMTGRLVGWKVLVLIHNKRTIRKYEEILKINVREAFPEEGEFYDKSVAYNLVKTLGSYWKAVSGELKHDQLKESRSELIAL